MESENWDRPYFKEALYDPFIFLVIYGDFEVDFTIDYQKYRVEEIPEGIELVGYGPESNPEVVKSFLIGYLWEDLGESDSLLAAQIGKAGQCYIIKGKVSDADNLSYFRNIIGLSSYLLDHGGVSVYDPHMFRFWSKSEWNTKIFKPHSPNPRNHVQIIQSEEGNGTSWLHTRGMRKFGRPDLSIHEVKKEDEETVLDMLSRFIELQAFGGIIEEGQSIKINSLPDGMWCENKGDFEDPDFNNKHIEIHWE